MSDHWKMEAEIEYCVPCGYGNLASYMMSDLFQAAGPALAISVVPGHSLCYEKEGLLFEDGVSIILNQSLNT